jgi:GTP-binding protein
VPRFAQPGEAGEESKYLFELRVMADIGLVGYPNAGKSTLLTAISRAHPKIAAYPFTTLYPNVGIVDYLEEYQRVTVCDIPGLIEGAHENVGLGHEFLRHIRRCRALVLLIDMAGVDGRDPWEDYTRLLNELSLYDPELIEKPRILVANKMDEEAAETNLSEFKKHTGDINLIRVSAAFDVGMDLFKQAIKDLVMP